MKESDLQIMVADYLRLRYPKVLFHSDFGSGIKMTKGQAIKQKRQNGGRRGWPDMFVAQPRAGALKWGPLVAEYDDNGNLETIKSDIESPETIKFGLFLELKKEGEKLLVGKRVKNRFLSIDGKEYKTEHLKEQADVIYELNQRGYAAYFAVGFEQAKQIIDDYLEG